MKTPLRQVLVQTLMSDLQTKVSKLMEAQDDSPLILAAKKSNILMENRSIPYVEWNSLERKLQLSNQTPVSLTKMCQHCTELQEGFRDVNLIMKFHALPTKVDSPVTPWRLQMSAREDRTYELMLHLANSQVWTLLGASLKRHNLHQSSLATNLEQSLGLKPPKGRGKGKTKTKSTKMTPAKLEP